MATHLKLVLREGPPNIHGFLKTATSGVWTRGDLVYLSSGKLLPKATTDDATLETEILGVAAKTEAADANAETNYVYSPVHVIIPEQVWTIHVEDGQRANDYTVGAAYKIGYLSTETAYNVGTYGGSSTIQIDECYYLTSTAATAGDGAVVVGYLNKGVGDDADYGGRIAIRFTPDACQNIYG